MKIATAFAEVGRKRRTAAQTREVIQDLHREFTGEKLGQPPLRQVVEDWLQRKQPEVSRASFQAAYTGACRKFSKFLGLKADLPIDEITRADLIAFRNAEAARRSGKTTNLQLKILRMLFKSARQDSLISADSCEVVDGIRQTRESKRRAFTIDELRCLLSVADPEWRSMILFGVYTGQRLRDLALLTWENVDPLANEIRRTTRKTGRTMIIPIASPLQEHIESLSTGDDAYPPMHPRAFRIAQQSTTGSLGREFGDLLARAGLRAHRRHIGSGKGRDARRVYERLGFHSLRATATTLLHEAGVPLDVAQERIGHDSAEVHRTYVRSGRQALQDAA